MPKDIQKAMQRLSIQEKTTLLVKQMKQRPKHLRERWVYGFHLKNKLFRRLSEVYGLPWKTNPLYAITRLQDHILFTSSVISPWEAFHHRGRCNLFIVFLEDDGRKRLENNRYTEEQMDKIRSVLLLPEGTKPKWYCKSHNYFDDEAELSSEDEDFPLQEHPNWTVNDSRKQSKASSTDNAEESDSGDDESDSYDEVGIYLRALEEYYNDDDDDSTEVADGGAKATV